MDMPTRGRMPTYWNGVLDPYQPWYRVGQNARLDARVNPQTGGGRRLRHPFFKDIIYPRNPDVTLNLGADLLPKATSTMQKTLTTTAVITYLENPSDVVIKEIWTARDLSTLTDFFRSLYEFWRSPLPPGRFIGYMPKDRTEKIYAVQIINVQLGKTVGDINQEELGPKRPGMMREQLALALKPIARVGSPSGVMVAEGL